jgi:protein TonB
MPRDLSNRQRWALALSVLATHVVVGWLIAQSRPPELMGERAPIEVQLIAPTQAPPVVTPTPPQPEPVPQPKVAPPKPVLSTRAPTRNVMEAPPEPARQPVIEAPALPTPPVPAPMAAPPVTAPAASAVAAPPPVQPQTPKELSISSVRRLRDVEPIFPPTSRRLNESGTVILAIVVDENGKASSATVVKSSGFPRLDKAAIVAALATPFQPYTENGQPRAFRVESPYVFEPAD